MTLKIILGLGLTLPGYAETSASEWWFRMLDAHSRVVEVKLTPPGAREQARLLRAQGTAPRPTVSVEELRRERRQPTARPEAQSASRAGAVVPARRP